MAIRTLTMSNPLAPTSRRSGFLFRLVLLLLFSVGIVFWLNALDQHQENVPQDMMIVFVNTIIALACSFGARFFFYRRNWFIRIVTALASLVICLYVLGYITNWRLGIGPLEFWRKSVDWFEAAQLGGGALLTLLGLKAWWRRSSSISGLGLPVRAQRPMDAGENRVSPQIPFIAQPRSKVSMKAPRHWSERPPKGSRLKVAGQARLHSVNSLPDIEKGIVSRSVRKPHSKRRKLFQRKPEMQISVYEDHRCPFCLETVKRNDPRGVKECDVCHTLHHKDCWDITGMCQVPHLNS